MIPEISNTIIDESKIIENVDENLALAYLLVKDILFLNTLPVSWGDEPRPTTTCVYVIANDIFAWGCADAECITNSDGENPSEIIELYKLVKENEKLGYIKWLCLKRNEKPQGPVVKWMKEGGYWDDQLESLPENGYDIACRQYKKSNP